MSELISGGNVLKKTITAKDKAVILFYASWCPFSRAFLPVFERHAESRAERLLRFLVDDAPEICDAYDVEVYPTVLFFEKGKVVRRLDGVAGRGLDEGRLTEFITSCGV